MFIIKNKWLKFSLLLKDLLFMLLHKNCKQGLGSIKQKFITPVHELFDNPSQTDKTRTHHNATTTFNPISPFD